MFPVLLLRISDSGWLHYLLCRSAGLAFDSFLGRPVEQRFAVYIYALFLLAYVPMQMPHVQASKCLG